MAVHVHTTASAVVRRPLNCAWGCLLVSMKQCFRATEECRQARTNRTAQIVRTVRDVVNLIGFQDIYAAERRCSGS